MRVSVIERDKIIFEGRYVNAGLNAMYHLPIDVRRPFSAPHEAPLAIKRGPCVMEPADAWHIDIKRGWLPQTAQPKAVASPPAVHPNRVVFKPLSVRMLDTPSPSYRPPLCWLSQPQSSDFSSPDAEGVHTPPRVETSWEVFEFLAHLDLDSCVSLPELNLGKRLARRLLRHSHSAHGQGLKVFYIAVDDTLLASCPAAASDPAKLIMHASLATALLQHPCAAYELAVKRAIFASKPASRPGLLPSKNAQRVADWAPRIVGGTRLVLHRHVRQARNMSCLSLEPSEHYGHAVHEGPLFEQLAAFHANVLHLAGCELSVWPSAQSMMPLAKRIEELRHDRSPVLLPNQDVV